LADILRFCFYEYLGYGPTAEGFSIYKNIDAVKKVLF